MYTIIQSSGKKTLINNINLLYKKTPKLMD
jgi:hypothetical protein